MTSQRGVGKAGIDRRAENHKAAMAVCPLRVFAARTIWGKFRYVIWLLPGHCDGGASRNMPDAVKKIALRRPRPPPCESGANLLPLMRDVDRTDGISIALMRYRPH